MKYRSEIDGLRAIAVAPVILLHAGFDLLPGGFLGVDIFFVISGYLITSILLAEMSGGTFSTWAFYERRARRILPALFLVMLVSTAFAYLWMLPDALENFGQSLVATTLFSNNVLLAMTSGYWDLESEFKPILHTWSLAVEEQYYILFPLLLLAIHKYLKRSLLLVLLSFLIVSLAYSQWASIHSPSSSFYMLHTRAWELMIGAVCAVFFKRTWSAKLGLMWSNFLSATGLAMIGMAMLLYGHETPTPSLYSLVPTVGAALIILFGCQGTWVHAVLGQRVFVFLGLISYSAYLWHQPLLAFARIYSVNAPTHAVNATLVATTFLLAWLTWKYVEQPCRNRERVSAKSLILTAIPVSMAFMSFGIFLHLTHGVPTRVFPAEAVADGDIYISYNMRVHQMSRDQFQEKDSPKILVMGNSYARDFVNMVVETYPNTDAEIIYRDFHYVCVAKSTDPVIQGLLKQANVVILASGDAEPDCLASDIASIEADGKQLHVVGTKKFGFNLNWIARLDDSERGDQYNKLLAETIKDESRIEGMTPVSNFISLMAPIVKNGTIPITDEQGRMLTADRSHLTRYGAVYLGREVLPTSALHEVLGAGALRRPAPSASHHKVKLAAFAQPR